MPTYFCENLLFFCLSLVRPFFSFGLNCAVCIEPQRTSWQDSHNGSPADVLWSLLPQAIQKLFLFFARTIRTQHHQDLCCQHRNRQDPRHRCILRRQKNHRLRFPLRLFQFRCSFQGKEAHAHRHL